MEGKLFEVFCDKKEQRKWWQFEFSTDFETFGFFVKIVFVNLFIEKKWLKNVW